MTVIEVSHPHFMSNKLRRAGVVCVWVQWVGWFSDQAGQGGWVKNGHFRCDSIMQWPHTVQ